MTGLARLILRRRKAVVAIWFVLTVIGAASAGQIKWFESFSIPGYSAYEANQRTMKDFGSGLNTPLVAVVTTKGDVTQTPGVKQALEAAIAAVPHARSSSFFSTGSSAYVSKDRHTTFMEVYPPGINGFKAHGIGDVTRAAARAGLDSGVTANGTGHDPLQDAPSGGPTGGPA